MQFHTVKWTCVVVFVYQEFNYSEVYFKDMPKI